MGPKRGDALVSELTTKCHWHEKLALCPIRFIGTSASIILSTMDDWDAVPKRTLIHWKETRLIVGDIRVSK
jgi:hypothetical protein